MTEEKQKEMDEFQEERLDYMKHPALCNLFLEVTSRCNARCEHCGSRCDAKEQGKEISADDLKKALKEIADCYDASSIFLNVTGGEPLMRKDLFDILEYAVSLGYYWGMTSNGMLIDQEMVKKLEKANMSTVSISIDGLKDTHESFRKVPNCYEKIFEGIRLMQESPVIEKVQVTTVANQKNIDELEELYQLLLDHGVQYWRIVSCDPIGRALDNNQILLDKKGFQRLFDFMQEKQKEGKMTEITYGCSHYLGPKLEGVLRHNYFMCYTGIFVGSILSNGDIYVCPNVPRRKELIQGNIKTDSFVDVWENGYQFFRDPNRTACSGCKKCKHWKYCGGDSMHTWDFEEKKPLLCLKELFDEG